MHRNNTDRLLQMLEVLVLSLLALSLKSLTLPESAERADWADKVECWSRYLRLWPGRCGEAVSRPGDLAGVRSAHTRDTC